MNPGNGDGRGRSQWEDRESTGGGEANHTFPAAFAGVLVFLRPWNFALQVKIKLFERLYRELFYFDLRF